MKSERASWWRHPVFQGLAVLVGILVAFGIDSWGQEQSERASERTYLEALGQELTGAHRGFVSRQSVLQGNLDLTQEVLRILNSPEASNLPDDSVNALALEVGPFYVHSPPRAALDDLINSGGIALVESASLRRAIASYEQALASDREVQELMMEIWLTHLAPYRYAHSTLGLYRLNTQLGLRVDVDRDTYVRNRTYTNLLMAAWLRVNDVSDSNRSTIEALDHVQILLVELRSAS